MNLKAKTDMGFLRNDSRRWNVSTKRKGSENDPPLKILSSTSCHYVIPGEVAPQQSFVPLHVTVDTKMKYKLFFLTLRFPQLVRS